MRGTHTRTYLCPQCQTEVSHSATACPHCHVDLVHNPVQVKRTRLKTAWRAELRESPKHLVIGLAMAGALLLVIVLAGATVGKWIAFLGLAYALVAVGMGLSIRSVVLGLPVIALTITMITFYS